MYAWQFFLAVFFRELLTAERVRMNDGNTPYEFANEQGRYFWSRYETAENR